MSRGASIEPWVVMWGLAISIFAVLKLWTFAHARSSGAVLGRGSALAYLILWPGMDPHPFAEGAVRAKPPETGEWAAAAGKTLLGLLLFRGAGVFTGQERTLAAGWLGMIGIVFLLHFGSFHLLALFWRRSGVSVVPIMRAPLRSAGLGEFWGARWNLAFRDLSYTLLLLPLMRRFGSGAAFSAVFLFSGLVHDAVISVPAGAGFGLPTAYFILQGAGIAFERSRFGKSMGLGRGVPGRVYAWIVAAGPAYFLFHPPFVERVIVPFMRAAGVLAGC